VRLPRGSADCEAAPRQGALRSQETARPPGSAGAQDKFAAAAKGQCAATRNRVATTESRPDARRKRSEAAASSQETARRLGGKVEAPCGDDEQARHPTDPDSAGGRGAAEAVLPGEIRGDAAAMGAGDGLQPEPIQSAA